MRSCKRSQGRSARDQDERIGGQYADRLQRARIERRFRKQEVRDAEGELGRAQERVAVGRRAQHRLGADAAARTARAVLDHDLPSEIAARLVGGEAAQKVGRAAGRIRHDERHRAVRIAALRVGRP